MGVPVLELSRAPEADNLAWGRQTMERTGVAPSSGSPNEKIDSQLEWLPLADMHGHLHKYIYTVYTHKESCFVMKPEVLMVIVTEGKIEWAFGKPLWFFLAKCKAKPLILSEGTRFFHLSPQFRFCALGSDFAACVGNSAFWRPQIEWRPNRCRNRYAVPIR